MTLDGRDALDMYRRLAAPARCLACSMVVILTRSGEDNKREDQHGAVTVAGPTEGGSGIMAKWEAHRRVCSTGERQSDY